MREILFSAEPVIRLSIFVGVFALIAVWEYLAPRRRQIFLRRARWPGNLGIAMLNTLLLRIVAPSATVGIAALMTEYNFGVLNLIALPAGVAILMAVILLDLIIYLQHRLFHVVPFFWKFHRMHHTDLDFDTTTAIRFHPIEIFFSGLIKLVTIVAIGPPVIAVFIFEVLLNATAMFNHGNINISTRLDGVLRLFLVTPDMHRVHHSVVYRETNSNYGFNLPWWDRIFNTYRAQPESGHDNKRIGIAQFPNARELGLLKMLSHPFRRPAAASLVDNTV